MEVKNNNLVQLGYGVNTITKKSKIVCDFIKFKRINKFFCGPALSNTYFFDTIDDLLRQFDSRFNLNTTVPYVPSTVSQVKLNLSDLKQNSTCELYYVLEMHKVEDICALEQPYELDKNLISNLKNMNPVDFFNKYGDSFVNSITYGSWALVIIQISFLSLEQKRKVVRALHLPEVTSMQGLNSFSSLLEKKLHDQQFQIHLYSNGLDCPACIVKANIKEIDDIIEAFNKPKTTPLAQLGWSFQSYKLILKDNYPNIFTMQAQISKARKLMDIINKCIRMLNLYWQAFNMDYAVNNSSTAILENEPAVNAAMVRLLDIRSKLSKAINLITNYSFDEVKLKQAADVIVEIITDFSSIEKNRPKLIEAWVTVLRVSGSIIQFVTHKFGEYQFELHPPSNSDCFKFKIDNQVGNNDLKLKLKQYIPKQHRPRFFGLIPNIFKPKQLTKDAIRKGSSEVKLLAELSNLTQPSNKVSKNIPINRALTRLYLKPSESVNSAYFVTFNAHFFIKLPPLDISLTEDAINAIFPKNKVLSPLKIGPFLKLDLSQKGKKENLNNVDLIQKIGIGAERKIFQVDYSRNILCYFLGDGTSQNPSCLDFEGWYHPDVIHFLLQLAPNRTNYIRVIFDDALENKNTQTFKRQIQSLTILSQKLNRPAIFISKEPGDQNHFICGLIKNDKLLLINPLGITTKNECYKTLFELKQENAIQEVWLSNNRLQRHNYEERGLVSCGPITLETAIHILTQFTLESLEKFWTELTMNQAITHAQTGLSYHEIDIAEILPVPLIDLQNSTDENTYKSIMESIRLSHYRQLESLSKQNVDTLNAPAQVVFNNLITTGSISDVMSEYELLIHELELETVSPFTLS